MIPLCPLSLLSLAPEDASQTISVPSADAENNRGADFGALGDHATDVTDLE